MAITSENRKSCTDKTLSFEEIKAFDRIRDLTDLVLSDTSRSELLKNSEFVEGRLACLQKEGGDRLIDRAKNQQYLFLLGHEFQAALNGQPFVVAANRREQ